VNAADRDALKALTDSINALAVKVDAIEYLAEPDAKAALTDLVRIAPTLNDLAEGYKAAGWFGRFIKWIGGIGGALLALVAIYSLYFGDGKP
jgi:HEAT repeat protein